jgi:uncharacterized membrane protein HdeD (DUF308 family)
MMSASRNFSALVAADLRMLREGWGWFVGLGVVLVALGLVGLVLTGLFTLGYVVLLGWFFLIGGVLEAGHAVWRKGWAGFWPDLIGGVLSAVVGVLILARPGEAAAVLTVLIGAVFLVGGIFRVGAGVATRNPYGGWMVLHGAISALLGLVILARWPFSAEWVIGTLVAIDLIFDGARLISLGLAARKLPENPADVTLSVTPPA